MSSRFSSSDSVLMSARPEFRLQLLAGTGKRGGTSASKPLSDISSSIIDSSSVSSEGLPLVEVLPLVALPLVDALPLVEMSVSWVGIFLEEIGMTSIAGSLFATEGPRVNLKTLRMGVRRVVNRLGMGGRTEDRTGGKERAAIGIYSHANEWHIRNCGRLMSWPNLCSMRKLARYAIT